MSQNPSKTLNSHSSARSCAKFNKFFFTFFIIILAIAIREVLRSEFQTRVEKLEKSLVGNATSIKDLQDTNQQLQAKVKELETSLVGNATSIKDLQDTNQQLQAKVKELQKETESELMRISHRESGYMSQQYDVAPEPLRYGSWIGDRCMRKAVQFEKPFSKEPTFVIGFALIDTDNTRYIRLEAHAENVSVNGFEFVCCTWADSIIYGFNATWTAFEN